MASPGNSPLTIALDGGLLKTDLRWERALAALSRAPRKTLRAFWEHRRDRPARAAALARLGALDPALLPLDAATLARARAARAEGRDVTLVAAADPELAAALAARLEPEAEAAGPDPSRDTGIWWALLRALRPHQYVKNALLLLPLIASHRTGMPGPGPMLWAFAAFCAAASAIYIVNDLLDLDADRRHETKRFRPFAAGTVPIPVGLATALGLALSALVVSALIGWQMLLVVIAYMALSLGYSAFLKSQRWIDIWVLALLYSLRVLAGGVASGIGASSWLVTFVFSVFMSLGCVKRMTELARARTGARLPGRAYRKRDRPDLLNMSILTGLNGVIVFLTYSYSEAATLLYDREWSLRLAAVPLCAWLARMISTGWAGSQTYDPIVFALRDRWSLVFAGLVAACVLLASAPL